MAELPYIVQDLLQNKNKMQDIVSKGMEKVREQHTWDARAKQIISWIENI
jgi:glycosyltransferase involved in cell wall biosynthesis